MPHADCDLKKIKIVQMKYKLMKIKTIFLALMFFVTTNVIAQKEKPIYSYVEQRTFLETQKIDFVDNRIIVVVQIDGENYNFIVDTGGPTALDNKLVKKLNLTPRRIVEAGTGGVKKDSVGLYILPSLKIKEIEFVNTLFSNLDLGFLSKCGQIDGILGANLMSNCVWQIDIQKKQITFSNNSKKLSNLENKAKMELYGKQSSPLIIGVVNNKIEEVMLFDTGDPALFSWRKAAYKVGLKSAIKKENTFKTYGSPYGGVFGQEPNDTINYVFIDKLEIGSTIMDTIITQVSNDNISKFGVTYLENYIVTLDFPKKRFYAKSIENSKSQTRPFFIEYSPKIINGKVYLDEIPLNEKEITLNSQVIEVNGVRLDSFKSECELKSFLKICWMSDKTRLKVLLDNSRIIEIGIAKS
jgi:hypothetical protein